MENSIANVKKIPYVSLFVVLALSLSVYFIFKDALYMMQSFWANQEAYSYGYLIPFIVIYLVWQKWPEVIAYPFKASWAGVAVVFLGVFLSLLGTLSTTMLIIQYAFVITLIGLFLAIMGWRSFRIIVVPLCILFLMIPLPQFLYQNLSGKLQLLSSQLGVDFIRLFGISVNLQGNVIDLGTFQLQVVEACSGLNYLFPLVSFGIICAYLFKAPLWQRATVFLSALPLTVLLNSFRIGVIGILVDNWGKAQAEGFLHQFEGWVVFMACVAAMLLEIWLLTRLTRKHLRFSQVFGIDTVKSDKQQIKLTDINLFTPPLLVSCVLLCFSLGVATTIGDRDETIPQRTSFASFPLHIADWNGVQEKIKDNYLQALKLSDYALNEYTSRTGDQINFYSAYYNSQRNGATIHSPRSCIPGDGWEILDHKVVTLKNLSVNGQPLAVNRVVIQKGPVKQLVYYWFQQRGRIITNEYLAKWYLFWDSIRKNRTDGALVRLVTQTKAGEPIKEADQRLVEFASDISQKLGTYIPG